MSLSELQQVRLDKVTRLRELGIDPYPTTAHRTITIDDAIAAFERAERADPSELTEDGTLPVEMTIVGRVVAQRQMGKSLFMPVEDGSGRLQLYLRKNDLPDNAFDHVIRLYDLGDFVQATGHLFRTRTGEISLRAASITMLSKALNAPPEKWHGLTDIETRYRRRYADLISNPEVRDVFRARARIVSALRRELDERGYLEVETPVLQPLYGGAAARPFTTQHNALDQTFYLRIADELYLKRLIVGGYERVYEIAKDFRNEGIDRFHSPEFTMLEFYEAYADYTDMMDIVESLMVAATVAVYGEPRFTYRGDAIDMSPPWPRKTLREAILEYSGVDYGDFPDQASLLRAARAAGADVPGDTVWPKIVDELLKQFVRPNLIQPIFLYDYPVSLSPLAKRRPDDPTHAERFQPFFCGGEMGNAFTELNDPLDQLARFRAQERNREQGDDEAMPIDADYINALMFGMPPTGGVGIGIDRLVMVLTGQDTLRDVVLFPALRNMPVDQDPVARTISDINPVAQGLIPPIDG